MKYVYLIGCGDDETYKLGQSKHPEKRLKELQTGNSKKIELLEKYLTEHYDLLETTLHRKFMVDRESGEWFKLKREDVSMFIETCDEITKTFNYLKKNSTYGLK